MQSLAIIGSQWGDEGKGKITDLLGQKCDYVVRYQGGNNAGHTIIVGDQKIVLHLIPSGILHDHCTSVVGHGVVFCPRAFKEELEDVQSSGVNITPERLKISENCSVITIYNKILDAQRESQGPVKIGTTGKGIGPAYEDKTSRKGLKLKDLLDREILEKKLRANMIEKEVLFKHLYNIESPSIEKEVEELFELGKLIKPFLADTFSMIDKAVENDKKILFEGAQGVLLDIDYGTYPFVTSSSTSAAGIYSGAGLPGKYVEEVLGITKAYTTRVGEGPFPTEMFCDLGEKIQTIGNEFGATTGRKRRCGWIDLPLLKYSVKASNITSIALTKVDVLSGIEELKVCVGYRYKGEEIDCAYPGIDLSQVEPILKDMKPFNDDFKSDEMSEELKEYLDVIEGAIGAKVGILAFGPERSQIKFIQNYF
ncbi:MAG: adenylosuccinate synthase [Halobacteriovoraceae bacterium]|nr:adenylosuccinate synthase [Halobacteriovoraceae bacterium]